VSTTKLNLSRTRRLLNEFRWADLFIDELGWSQPPTGSLAFPVLVAADTFTLRPIAHLGGAWVYGVSSTTGLIPDQKVRHELHQQVVRIQREHLLIFQDAAALQTLWSWPRFEGSKMQSRTHLYVKDQPGDLFLSKLSHIYFDLDELDEKGAADLVTVTKRLKQALDVSPVTREFYKVFSEQQHNVVAAVLGLPDEPLRRHYASVLLTRLMFVYFLQKKFLLDNRNDHYLEQKLTEHQAWAATQPGTPPTFYQRFLRLLFFEGFALHPEHRTSTAASLLGTIPYLNGGLFLEHHIEEQHPKLDLPDEAIEHLLGVFTRFTWNLDDRAGGNDREINPDVLGYIFEKYINTSTSKQKDAGAFYTPVEITTYLCDQTVDGLLLQACNDPSGSLPISGIPTYHFRTLKDLLPNLDDRLAKKLLRDVLPHLSLLDPACGSGAFLVAALKKLETVYAALVGYVKVKAADPWLLDWKSQLDEHKNTSYFVRKEIITRNLFGVDLMDEAVEIARLRLFLALVATANSPEDLEPLPNIDFNLMEGNGLVGLLHIQEADFDRYSAGNVLAAGQWKKYQDLLAEKNQLIDDFKGIGTTGQVLEDTAMNPARKVIDKRLTAGRETLNQVLLAQLQTAKVNFQEAQWDASEGKEKYTKKLLVKQHLLDLRPFHWGYEFDRVLNNPDPARRGFDAIIANPPWEAFKPNAKEFFEEYAEVVQKKNMHVKDFEKKKAELLRDPDLRQAWEAYLSRFPHVSDLFRVSPDYMAQVALVNGKRTSADTNLYKLFLERCFRLLRPGGRGGIIVSTGFYTDLGAKGLRELLFNEGQVTHIFGLSNERKLFEDVHHAFKYAIVAFEKGGSTETFTAAFRIQPREAVSRDDIQRLFSEPAEQVRISVATVRQLSPDSHSIPEFRNEVDQSITEKIGTIPKFAEAPGRGGWGAALTNGFHSSKTSLPKQAIANGRIPFLRGENITHFDYLSKPITEWANEVEGRLELLGKKGIDSGQLFYYQKYTLVYRRVNGSANARTLLTTITPVGVFVHESLALVLNPYTLEELLFLTAVMNSFVIDESIRRSVSLNISHHFVYALPIIKLPRSDNRFERIIRLSAQLICVAPAFDELAQAAGLADHTEATIDPVERATLRAELDALVAHLYGLTEAEFEHVLATFPLVKEEVKAAALDAFRLQQPHPDDATLAALITEQAEGRHMEFKVGAYHNPHDGQKDGSMITKVVEAAASFLNSFDGGTLLLGVADKPVRVVGIADDLATGNFTGQAEPEDAYAPAISQAITNRLGSHLADLLDITFHTIQGHRVCRIAIRPADKEVKFKDKLLIRGPRGKLTLNTADAIEYIRRRFSQP
jgi:hypothetical protein